jgi:hypothetical protein
MQDISLTVVEANLCPSTDLEVTKRSCRRANTRRAVADGSVRQRIQHRNPARSSRTALVQWVSSSELQD